jgi:hypothetical protein
MDVPEGSVACPTCGYHFAGTSPEPNAQPLGDAQQPADAVQPNAQYTDPNAQYANPYPAQPTYTTPYPAQPEKKSNTGLIVGIIAGVVVVAAVVVCLILFVFGSKTDGRYSCDTFAAFGMDFYLDVDGEDVTMVIQYDYDGDGEISDDEKETEEGTIEFDGDVCTITIDDESLDCEYDKKEKTITVSDDDYGMELVFTKED